MSKISKEYVSDVKHLFPIMSKNERKYLKKLRSNVEDFCEENNIETKAEIYEKFDTPNNIVKEYFLTADMESFIKKIRVSKYIKFAISTIIAVLVLSIAINGYFLYEEKLMMERQNRVFEEGPDKIIIIEK